MSAARTTISALLALGLVATLAACGGGGSDPAACLTAHPWRLDVSDAANQLGDNLVSNGLDVISSNGTGQETFTFKPDGTVTLVVDLTYTVQVLLEGGHTLMITQNHRGSPRGGWAFGEDDVVTFNGWDNRDYAVSNTLAIDGASTDAPITVPEESFSDSTPMTITCSATKLTTQIDPSPFTNKWRAVG